MIQKHTKWDRLRALKAQYDRVQNQAAYETLHRFRWLSGFLIPLLVGLSYWFSLDGGPNTSVRILWWDLSLALVHIVIAGLSVFLWILCSLVLRVKQHRPLVAITLQVVVCGCYLLFGIATTLLDLAAETPAGISAYMLVTALVGLLSLIRPAIAVPMFFISGLLFDQLSIMIGLHYETLKTLRIIALTAPTIAIFASAMLWHQYVKMVVLQRELCDTNDALLSKQRELEFLAERDALTGLYNRRQFNHLVRIELARSDRSPTTTCVLVIDIDFFKSINDNYGHPIGDDVLVQVAKLFAKGVRASDVVARFGGEEFVVLLPNTSINGSMALAEKLRYELCVQPLITKGGNIHVTASFGVTELPAGQTATIDEIYQTADRALYTAKQRGRNRVEFAELLSTVHKGDATGDVRTYESQSGQILH